MCIIEGNVEIISDAAIQVLVLLFYFDIGWNAAVLAPTSIILHRMLEKGQNPQ